MAVGSSTGYELLVKNGDHRFLLASGLIARVPMGMRALGVLLTISAMTGSYAVAGAAAGLATATQALVAPRWAHLPRRFGIARVVGWSVPMSVVLTAALVMAAHLVVDAWILVVLAGLSGACVLPMGALSRGVWESVLDPGRRDSAFALEGVFDEVAYVAGPALVVALEYAVAPGAGLLAATILYLVGGVATASRVGRVHPRPSGVVPPSRALAVLKEPTVLAVVLAYLMVGGFFGALDVGVVARAEAAGQGSLAGWLLAVLGATSAVAGLTYGAVTWRVAARTRMCVATVLLTLLLSPLLLTEDLVATVVWLALAGTFVSPVLISANGVVAACLGPGRAVLGLALLASSVTVGMGLGTFSGGLVADDLGPTPAIALAVAYVGTAALVQALAVTRRGPRLGGPGGPI